MCPLARDNRPLHIAQISFRCDPKRRKAVELLEAWHTVADVAEATAAYGMKVSVFQASPHWETFNRNTVQYHFLPFGDNDSTRTGRVGFRNLIGSLTPDVLHVQGLGFPRFVVALAAMAPRTPILVQDHASRPPRMWRRWSWRRGLEHASGVAFCARELAVPFLESRLLQPHTKVYEIPESTTHFTPGSRDQARQATGIGGDPCVLWVGNLTDNKDPLTVLEGIAQTIEQLPGLQLWCCFGIAPLLREVQQRIQSDPRLMGRVHLLGRVPHERIEELMRAADLLVQGSHREGSGYSIIEALACALPPVVTDIPSFRSLTAGGAVGRLWRCEDPQDLCQALVALTHQPQALLSTAARSQFDRELGLARRWAASSMPRTAT